MKRRKDGRYQKSFTFEGRRYTVYADKKSDLDDAKAAKKEQLKARKEQHDNPTLDKYYDIFTDLRRGKVKEATLRCQKMNYDNCSDVKIDGVRLGDMRIRDITPKDIQRVQKTLIDSDRHYSTTTINDRMKHLSHVFNCAVRDETVDKNPCACIEHLRRTEQPARETIHRGLTEEETEKFLKAANDSFYLPYYQMQLQTGMRLGEIGALTAADIDKDFIHVTKTVTRDEIGAYLIGESAKTDAGYRVIPLNKAIKEIIRRQKALTAKLGIRSILLFPSMDGEILRDYTVNRDIKRICKIAGIESFATHALRDTFATRWMEQRPQDFKILSEILGHADVKITLNLYTHVMSDKKKEAMKSLKISM